MIKHSNNIVFYLHLIWKVAMEVNAYNGDNKNVNNIILF